MSELRLPLSYHFNTGTTLQLQSIKILVVDDDEDILSTTKKIFSSKEEYVVFTVNSGKKCLEFIDILKPDLILLDVFLPDLKGTDICRIIKENERYSDIGVILTSGMANSIEEQIAGLSIGADDYILRPVDKKVLLARVEARLRSRKSESLRKDAERKLSVFIELSQDIIITLDKDLNIKNLNSSFEKILGFKASDWQDKNFKGLISDIHGSHNLFDTKLMLTGFDVPIGLVLEDSNKNMRNFELTFSLVKVFETIIGFIFLLKDMGEEHSSKSQRAFRDKEFSEIAIREDNSLESLSKQSTAETSFIYASQRLMAAYPDIFEVTVEKYREILNLRAEERIYKISNQSSEKLKELADSLGFLKASPKDLIDLQKKVLAIMSKSLNGKKAMIYREEARITLIELMGYVMNYYRHLA